MKNIKKDDGGNYSFDGYAFGTNSDESGKTIYHELMESGDMTLDGVIESLVEHFDSALTDFLSSNKLKPLWLDMKKAPKDDSWILGVDKSGEQRVIKWTTDYPYNEGVWMFATIPTDYIDGLQTFDPVGWMTLPDKE